MSVTLHLTPTGRNLVSQIGQNMLDSMQEKVVKSFQDCIFCTPEEAQEIFDKNIGSNVFRVVGIDDFGRLNLEMEMGAFKMMNSPVRYVDSSGKMMDKKITNSYNTMTNMYQSYSNSNYNSTSSTTSDIPSLSGASFKISYSADANLVVGNSDRMKIEEGNEIHIDLPDGTILEVNKDGSFTINDENAKVIYRGNRIREFNRFINASDLLQEFIVFLGKHGVKQGQVLDVPIELLINWLVLMDAESDGEEVPPQVTPVESHPKLVECQRKHGFVGKCLRCGRFISHDKIRAGFNFCNIEHAQEHCDRLNLAS